MAGGGMYGRPLPDGPGPSGIGGWLLLPLISLLLTGFLALTYFGNILDAVFAPGVFDALINASTPPQTTIRTSFLVGGAASFVIVLTTVIVLSFFYAKKRQTPRLMIGYYLILIMMTGAWYYAGILMREVAPDDDTASRMGKWFARSGVAALIWIPYFIVSERVKNTFVR